MGSILSLGLFGAPLLLLGTGATLTSADSGSAGGGRAAADALPRPKVSAISDFKLAFQAPPASTTTSTTTPPPAPTTTTTAASAPVVVPQSTTTTTAGSNNSADGIATWYSEAPAGTCASPWLPKGVTLTVTDLSTGTTITCLVEDREADNPGRVVDLSPSGFKALAPLSQGVVQVAISW